MYFENHSSIKQIQENFQLNHIPLLSYTSTEEVKNCSKKLMPKKGQVLSKYLHNWLN